MSPSSPSKSPRKTALFWDQQSQKQS
jgi:hypothetical protein